MADRRLRRVVRRRGAFARRRSHPAGHPFSHPRAAQHRRPCAHPRPRRPHGRAHRSVAAAERAALRHAVCGGAVRSAPPVRAGRASDPGQRRAAWRTPVARAVHGRLHQRRAFDSGIECACDPHAAGHRGPYRGLEDRRHAADWRSDRSGEAHRARRRRRAGARRRFPPTPSATAARPPKRRWRKRWPNLSAPRRHASR